MTACGIEASPVSAAEPQPKNDIPSATATETSPTIEASPTAETMPASLEANQAALKKMGYEIRSGERGWELISPQDQVVLIASDTLTVQAFGANNEMIISPEQAFTLEKTIGAGMEQLLVLKNTEGNITHTFLERAGYWAPLLEQQTNPREIEQYPQVAFESIWNGQMAQTEALTAEPFPEGTFVPEGMAYVMWQVSGGYRVNLQDWGAGMWDEDKRYHTEVVNSQNDYRRWTRFYRSQTPEGVDVLIGTEQVLMPDGETSLFLHYVFGPEWPWEEDIQYAGTSRNLINSVFLARTERAEGNRSSLVMRPIISRVRFDGEPFTSTLTGEPDAAYPLYDLSQNTPTTILEGLDDTFRNFAENQGSGMVAEAGEEIRELQYMGLDSINIQNIWPGNGFPPSNYFNHSP